MAQTEEPIPEQRLVNRYVEIAFKGGGTFTSFSATWNFGLRDFVQGYEQYLRGATQDQYQFRMWADNNNGFTEIWLDFKNVDGIYLREEGNRTQRPF